jgi:hypothetical protein
MLGHLAEGMRLRAAHVARTTAIGLGAGILLCVGIAFWTAAGWMFLLTQTSAVNAAVIMGALYTGAALIGFGVVASRRRTPPPAPQPAPPPPTPSFDTLMGAFMSGVTAGARTRS